MTVRLIGVLLLVGIASLGYRGITADSSREKQRRHVRAVQLNLRDEPFEVLTRRPSLPRRVLIWDVRGRSAANDRVPAERRLGADAGQPGAILFVVNDVRHRELVGTYESRSGLEGHRPDAGLRAFEDHWRVWVVQGPPYQPVGYFEVKLSPPPVLQGDDARPDPRAPSAIAVADFVLGGPGELLGDSIGDQPRPLSIFDEGQREAEFYRHLQRTLGYQYLYGGETGRNGSDQVWGHISSETYLTIPRHMKFTEANVRELCRENGIPEPEWRWTTNVAEQTPP